jgi:DnaK suppressor protein
MPRTLMPTPDRPRPDLAARLPLLRADLEELRRFRLDQIADILAEGNAMHFDGDRQPDAANVGAVTARREVRAALEFAARQALADIEAALRRIQAGRYGSCLTCQGQIPLERLRIAPQTGFCIECQRWTDTRR